MSCRYKYLPLSSLRHTRLLLLHPSQCHSDTLECSIEELHIDATTGVQREYDALSYVWGDRAGSRPLLCGGATILVTPNCESALRQLRHRHDTRLLWVDSICINQTNVFERNSQVRMMGDIYAEASNVLVWLGDSDPEIDYVLSTLLKAGETEKSQDERDGKILEFALAKEDPTFLCGNTALPWETLCPGLKSLLKALVLEVLPFDTAKLNQEIASSLIELEIFRLTVQMDRYENVNLYNFLAPAQGREATDPRDQIFAVLGLLPKEHPIQCILDYSLPVEEVYVQATLFVLQDQPISQRMANPFGKGCIKLPSWCVDFSRSNPVTPYYGTRHCASGQVIASQFSYNHQSKSLKLSGTVVDTIKSLQPFPDAEKLETLSDSEGNAERLACYHAFIRIAIDTMSASAPGRDQSAKLLAQGYFWKAVDVGYHFWEELRPLLAEFVRNPERWMLESLFRDDTGYERASLLPDFPEYAAIEQRLKICLHYMLFAADNATMIVTENGRLGHVDGYHAAEGDIVCVLFGWRWPVVLRRHGDEYELVAFTWMHDLMQGEAITDDMVVEDFVLI